MIRQRWEANEGEVREPVHELPRAVQDRGPLPEDEDGALPELRTAVGVRRASPPSPVTRFFEGGGVSQTLYGVSKTLFDST